MENTAFIYLYAFVDTFIEARRKMQQLIRPTVFACLGLRSQQRTQKDAENENHCLYLNAFEDTYIGTCREMQKLIGRLYLRA